MNPSPEASVSLTKLITEVHVRPEAREGFLAWAQTWYDALAGFPGFVSRETVLPTNPLDGYSFVSQFATPEALRSWRTSEVRSNLIAKLQPFLTAEGFSEIGGAAAAWIQHDTSVTEVILDRVKPGSEDAYRDWSRRVQEAQAKSGGYEGGYTQTTSSGNDKAWLTLMRFASVDDLERWMFSPEREALIAEGRDLVADSYTHQVDTSFPGWVPNDPHTGEPPPNWKASLLVLLGLYPIVALESLYLVPLLIPLKLHSAGLFIGNFISVAATGFITMPLFVKWFGKWLFPPKGSEPGTTLKGVALLVIIFAIEIAIFWNLLT